MDEIRRKVRRDSLEDSKLSEFLSKHSVQSQIKSQKRISILSIQAKNQRLYARAAMLTEA